MSHEPLRPDDVLRRAHAVGTYYGFQPFSLLATAKRGQGARAPYPDSISLDTLDPVAKDVVAFLKQVRDTDLAPSITKPLFVWHTNAAPGRTAPRTIVIQFHAMGVDRPIADAVLIRAVRTLASELTKETPIVRINSMGDKETRGRFARELTHYFRKYGTMLPPQCVSCAKRDLIEAAELAALEETSESLPTPTDHLSEASRRHFEGLLEYLEATDTPYELAGELLSRGGSWSETCFEIQCGSDIRIWGSRYNELARPFFRTSLPSMVAHIRITLPGTASISPHKNPSRPRFVFVHIGDEAKRESIKLADTLRHARIPLTQAIGIESLTEQMRLAESMNPQYLIIMGRKEALEQSVILRERATHSETFIPVASLVERLRAIG